MPVLKSGEAILPLLYTPSWLVREQTNDKAN